MDSFHPKWRSGDFKDQDGILVGSDRNQEWLLPWWWKNYKRHNDYPVAFVNLGLNPEMKKWCQERGTLIDLPSCNLFVKDKEEIFSPLVKQWENKCGDRFWECRSAWFKKPLACLQTPFRRSIWIDLDCEIRGSLKTLFSYCNRTGVALVKDRFDPFTPRPMYNSGVIVFQHSLPLIEEWATHAFKQNHLFRGDQELLSHLIAEKNLSISHLPPIYNWSRSYGNNSQALIHHWHGASGRNFIRYTLWVQQLSALYEK